ncbi:MAG: ABC transporter ATP-binding protein [Christensenella sp.]
MLLTITNLKKVYTRGRAFAAVDDVNLSIDEHDFVSIIGKSGSGKSTLMNMIVGLLRPDTGQILFDSKDLWCLNDHDMSLQRNKNIGYVPQGCGLLSNLSVIDNVRLPAFFFEPPPHTVERARELLKRVGLKGFENSNVSELSGGETRRVSIARALMCDPKIIVADEPTGDLDSETTTDIMNLFAEVNNNGTAILMVTHEQDSAYYGKRLFRMEKGKLENATS